MCSQGLGADYTLAWPQAEIAVMGAEAASDIIYSRDIKAAENPEEFKKEKIEEYRELLYNPYVAASMGYINAVVEPSQTRAKVIAALEALSGIALRYGLTVERLRALNGLSEDAFIHPGDRIIIRPGDSTSTPPPPTPTATPQPRPARSATRPGP